MLSTQSEYKAYKVPRGNSIRSDAETDSGRGRSTKPMAVTFRLSFEGSEAGVRE